MLEASGDRYLHINNPKLKGRVNQFTGKRYVSAGSRSDPGASGLMSPLIKTMRMTSVSQRKRSD
jgi:hypothetical protein